ncbi:hypothetical protein NYE33_20595 [Paenibacillus sp. FSL R10-2199]|uniref:hypothetical protein n=1 Tax=Paenibacillus sp. FSL R10-2199 TaxID=2975348 RepID=UPI0030F8FDFD
MTHIDQLIQWLYRHWDVAIKLHDFSIDSITKYCYLLIALRKVKVTKKEESTTTTVGEMDSQNNKNDN